MSLQHGLDTYSEVLDSREATKQPASSRLPEKAVVRPLFMHELPRVVILGNRFLGLQVYEYWYIFDMKLELLYLDGCPNYKQAQQALEQALLDENIKGK